MKKNVYHLATPIGRGAVATIILDGPQAFQIINCCFRSSSAAEVRVEHCGKILYGSWLLDGQLGEDLVVCPRSVSRVEIHAHGSEVGCQIIAQSLESAGAISVDGLDAALLLENGCRFAAEVRLAITKAPTKRTCRFLLDQRAAQKGFWIALAGAVSDHTVDESRELIDRFLQWSDFGLHLTRPWSVVLLGRPNVGKSSLINALLGFERSIVHSESGTTRDVVDHQTAFSGWPVRLFDTAGIRDTEDELERLGIERSEHAQSHADARILVVDSADFTYDDLQLQLQQVNPDLVIANKSDLASFDHPAIDCRVSAANGDGIEELISAIVARLIPETPPVDQAVPVSEFQIEQQRDLLAMIQGGRWQEAAAISGAGM